MTDLISILKNTIRVQKITQNEVARMMDVQNSSMSAWINGKSRIAKKHHKKILELDRLNRVIEKRDLLE